MYENLEPHNMDVLKWAEAVCVEADTAFENGDRSLNARLGANAGFAPFFTNVHKLHNCQIAQFPMFFPEAFQEMVRLYDNYQNELKITEAVTTKDSSIEERLGKLETLLTAFIESQKPVDEKPVDKKKAKKPAEVEATDGTNTEGQASKEE